jgi:beta-galactosidase
MKDELLFMVRNGRNRASIAIWGAGLNEGAKSPVYEKPMNDLCLAEDPTRPTSAARQAASESANNIFTFYGQNEFTPGDLPNANPDPNCVGFLNTEHTGHMFHGHSNRALHSEEELLDHATMMACMTSDSRNRAWCAGSLGWCAFDYYTHWNTSFQWRAVHGVFDVMHIAKPAAYFYRSQSGGDNYDGSVHPYVKIANFYAANSPADRRVYSNCQQVRLSRGSTAIATQDPDKTPYYVNSVGRPSSTWNLAHPPFTFKSVAYQANTMLVAEGLINNVVVATDTVRAQGSASTVRLIADPPVIEANGQDISRIEAYVVDENGTWIHSATNSLTWALTGNAAELFGDNPISAQAGACITLAKATLTPGTVEITASANGLAPQKVTIQVVSSGTTIAVPSLPVIHSAVHPPLQWRMIPARDCLTLPAALPLPAAIEVYTIGGERIFRGGVTNRIVKMPANRTLPFGMYVVKTVQPGRP